MQAPSPIRYMYYLPFVFFSHVLTKEDKKICCMSPKETGIGTEHLKLFAKKVPFRCQV